MNTRKFKLILSRQEGIYINTKTINLNSFETSAFASNPSGLGAKASYGLLKVGNRNINGNRNQDLLPITLEVAFKDYDKMNSFLEKVAWGDYKGVLEYSIPLNGTMKTYKRDVTNISITKTEKVAGFLGATLTMESASFWYEDTTQSVTLAANTQKIIAIDAESDTNRAILIDAPSIPDSFIISLSTTPSGNQKVTLRNLTGQGTLYTKFAYSSEDGNAYIRVVNSTGTVYKDNVESTHIDTTDTTSPFIQIPPKEAGYLRLTSSDAMTIELTIRNYYYAV